MNKRTHALLLSAMMTFALAGLACVPETNGGSGGSGGISNLDSMEKFASDAEFEEFMAQWAEDRDARSGNNGGGDNLDEGGNDAGDGAAGDADGAPPENEDITNTQEDDVDEGGIVKNVGDYLVVLRRGALYSVDVSESGETTQIDGIRVAKKEELNNGVWYDEMLVRGGQVYVIGYRYAANVTNDGNDVPNWLFGATEVTSFGIEDDGTIERGESMFFESNDYYSGTDYASRLVDGELIFYMPYYAFVESPDNPVPVFPQFLQHQQDNDFLPQGPIFNPTDIIQPIEAPDRITLHTVIQCDLPEDLSIDCSARSLLAEPARDFYVSRDHIYLKSDDYVYALSQTDDLAGAHATQGSPINQFSFSEVDDILHMGVTRTLEEDEFDDDDDYESWNRPQNLEMLSLPLSDFNADGDQSLDDKVEVIAEHVSLGWSAPNRHVDGWFLVGSGEDLYAHEIDSSHTDTFDLDGSVARVEAAPGIGALVFYQEYDGTSDLVIDSLILDPADAQLTSGTSLESTSQGEHRSHGFFFRPDDDGGLFGLPVIGDSGGYGWGGMGISNIGFFRADTDGSVDFRGAVSSSDDADGQCETSCVDWYGNTRPIFLHGRIYALMGSEIAEVDVTDDDVETVGSRVLLGISD